MKDPRSRLQMSFEIQIAWNWTILRTVGYLTGTVKCGRQSSIILASCWRQMSFLLSNILELSLSLFWFRFIYLWWRNVSEYILGLWPFWRRLEERQAQRLRKRERTNDRRMWRCDPCSMRSRAPTVRAVSFCSASCEMSILFVSLSSCSLCISHLQYGDVFLACVFIE